MEEQKELIFKNLKRNLAGRRRVTEEMRECKGTKKRVGIACINSNRSLRTPSARLSRVDGRTACVPDIQPTSEGGRDE